MAASSPEEAKSHDKCDVQEPPSKRRKLTLGIDDPDVNRPSTDNGMYTVEHISMMAHVMNLLF